MTCIDRECPAIIDSFKRRNIKSLLPDSISAKDPMYKRSGSSFDLKCIRSYQPFDDPRSIDWRLYGRTDRAYVKEYFSEENENLTFFIDKSASIGLCDVDGYKKCISSLAYILLGLGVGVTAVTFDSKPGGHAVRARNLSGHYRIDLLAKNLEFKGESDINGAYRKLLARSRQRRIVMFSDFHEQEFHPSPPGNGKLLLIDYRKDLSEISATGTELDILDPETLKTRTVSWNGEDRKKLEDHLRNRKALIAGSTKRIDYFHIRDMQGRESLYWAVMGSLYA